MQGFKTFAGAKVQQKNDICKKREEKMRAPDKISANERRRIRHKMPG